MGGKLACPDSEEKQKELADFLAAYPGADSVWVSGAEGETDMAWMRETGEIMPGSGEQIAYVVEYD